MSKSYCPFLYGKFRKFFQLAAIAVTLTAAGCAGSSDQSEEPVAAEGETSEALAGEEGSGLIIEQEGTDEAVETAEVAPEPTEMTEEGGEEDDMMNAAEAETVSTDEYTAPEETVAEDTAAEAPVETAAAPVEEAPESLDATLDDAVSAQPAPTESFEDTSAEAAADSSADAMLDEAASAPSMASTSNFGQSSGVLPPGVIASPGAAIFIKSKYEKSAATASFSGSNSGAGGQSYVVVPGDTVSGISRKIYGSFGHWKKIAAKNGISAPYILQPGTVIKFDADTSVAKAFNSGGQATGTNTVKVKHGDTLSKIASQLYGNSGSWKVLYNMNKGKISNPNQIFVGMVLSYNGSGSVAKAKKATFKKKAELAPVKKVEEPAVVAAPEAEPAPAAEDDVPAAVVVEDDAPEASPVADEEVDSTINVDIPTEEEE